MLWIAGMGLALSAGLATALAAQQPEDWQLVWQDEFNGERLDYSKWEVEVNDFGGGNDELQLYTDRPENVGVKGGNLVLTALADNPEISGRTRPYSSARLRTKHRGDWTYGRIEVRAKLPAGQGIWPAVWMLPTEEKYGRWAASGEIDIVEFKGQEPNRVHGTIHHGGAWPQNQYTTQIYTLPQGDFTSAFHTFALEWRPDSIRWLVDGKEYQRLTHWQSAGGKFPAPFDQPFHLIINLAVGGRFVGPPDSTTTFPRQMLIDYVRVYQ